MRVQTVTLSKEFIGIDYDVKVSFTYNPAIPEEPQSISIESVVINIMNDWIAIDTEDEEIAEDLWENSDLWLQQ